jgi:hypothetical protein
MGKIAAETLLRRIAAKEPETKSASIIVDPELVVRGTTAPAPMNPVTGNIAPGAISRASGTNSVLRRPDPPGNGAVEMVMTKTGVSQETAEAVLHVVASFLHRDPS